MKTPIDRNTILKYAVLFVLAVCSAGAWALLIAQHSVDVQIAGIQVEMEKLRRGFADNTGTAIELHRKGTVELQKEYEEYVDSLLGEFRTRVDKLDKEDRAQLASLTKAIRDFDARFPSP